MTDIDAMLAELAALEKTHSELARRIKRCYTFLKAGDSVNFYTEVAFTKDWLANTNCR